MKKSLVLILLFLIHQQLYAQTEYIVKVDLATGGITKIKKIDNVTWIAGATTAYDSINNRYTFCGGKTKTIDDYKLFTVNSLTGKVLSSPSFTHNPTPTGFSYNHSDNKFYVCRWDTSVKKEFVATVDLQTGIMADLFKIDSLSGIFIDGITFDNKHQKYYINGIKPTGAKGIFIIDIKNQSTKFKPSVASIGGLQYDKNLDKVVCLDWSGGGHTLSTIDSNGMLVPIGTIPTVISSITPGRFAYDQQKHYYIFCGRDAGGTDHLYTINGTNANIVNSPSYPTPSKGGNPQFDNLVFPIHDESLDVTYALYWEALTTSDTTIDTTLAIDIIPKQPQEYCIIAPNAFSPNGDGKNDVFCAKAICNARKFNMQIFNRRGQKVFESGNIKEGWDGNFKGSPAGMDTYVYMIQYQTDAGDPQMIQGNISLIR